MPATTVHPGRGTLIGRASGLMVYVSARIDPVTWQRGEYARTIDHGYTPDRALRLSIQGQAWHPRARRESESSGQIVDLVREVSPGLADLWERWHLNDLRPWCAHMALPADESYDARQGITCAATGYRYGMAWLYESLPANIADQVRAFGVEPIIGT